MKTLVVIAGPTASGKTSLSIKLALHYRSEIISADSRQFYRRMNIGTAKPVAAELAKVPHHFIDSLDVTDTYNIGRFETDALMKINSLFAVHEILFMTGGSGLYIDAVCKGLDEFPESDPVERDNLKRIYKDGGIVALQNKLKEIDLEYYAEVDINNPHRLMRAIEITITTGNKYSTLRKNNVKPRDFDIKKIGLLVDRAELYERINNRVEEMIKKGLVKEVEALLPYRNENAMQTVGYKEIIDFLDDKMPLPDAIELIQQNTRNYAKRQMTWLRRDDDIRWFDPPEIEKMMGYIEE